MNNYTQLVNNFKQITVPLLMLLLLAGCSNMLFQSWTVTQRNDKVVWADDDSQVAVAILSFEEKADSLFSETTNKRHFKHKVVVQNLNSSEQHPITEWREHQSGQLFFMKQAGYFIVESLLTNGARRFDKITENGNEILIIETPDSEHRPCQDSDSAKSLPARVHNTVIPSPDGSRLAHIYSHQCGKVTVEFLYANSLNLFDSQIMDVDEPMSAMWHVDGYIILTTIKKDKAWKVTPLAPQLPIALPKCISPITTSSEVSSEGQMAFFDGDKIATKNEKKKKAFGCQ